MCLSLLEKGKGWLAQCLDNVTELDIPVGQLCKLTMSVSVIS